MKKIIYSLVSLISLSVSNTTVGQNVGIGTNTPTEQLDVNGNINVSGTIKANGSDGAANQVLMKNSAGTLSWGDLSTGYKNFKGIDFTQTWTVPSGVTAIVVELWGAGGGGNANGGGGAGAYAVAAITVYPGQVLAVNIGSGGQGAVGSDQAGNGNNTAILNGSSTIVSAGGGFGAGNFPGHGGVISSIAANLNYYDIRGEAGWINKESYAQVAAGTFVQITEYGRGGNAPNLPSDNGGKGGFSVVNTSTLAVLTNYVGRQGYAHGGGGGGGRNNGNSGGWGYAIIRW